MTLRVDHRTICFLFPFLPSFLLGACHSTPQEKLAEAISLTPELEGVVLSVPTPSPHSTRGSHKFQRMELLKEVERDLRASSADPAWQGLLRLAVGDYRAAADVLSAEAEVRGGELLNDAAVAHMNLGRETSAGLSYFQALGLMDRAIEDLGWSPELGYNRALILTKLHLVDMALDNWKRIAQSGDPYWKNLASRNLSELSGRREAAARMEGIARAIENGELTDPRIIAEFTKREPYLARIAVEDHLLGRWARTTDDRRLRVTAETIRTIAAALKQAGRDKLLSDAAEVIGKVSGDPTREARLRQAHRDYLVARQLYEDQDTKAAEELFEDAERGFQEAGSSPFAYWAAFFRSICIYYRDAEKADQILSVLEETVDPDYRGLHGRVQWMRGTIDQVQGDVATALKRYFKAQEFMERSGGERGSAFTNVLIATAYDELGDFRRGWWYRMRALEILPYTNDYRRIHAMLSEALADLRRQDLALLSLPLYTQMLVNAKRWGKAIGLADGFRQRARTWIHVGEYERAIEDLALARDATASLQEGSLKENLLVSLDFAEALVEVGRDPNRSIQALDDAFRQQAAAGYLFEKLQVSLVSAVALEKQGKLDAAKKALQDAAAYFAATGSNADDLEIRARSAALARSVLERILEYELTKQPVDQEKVLLLADQMRSHVAVDIARRYLTAASGISTDPLGRRIMRRLPGGVKVVIHTTLATRLLTTVISSDGIRHEVSLERKEALIRLVGEFGVGVRLNPRNDRTREAASELYTKLVKPARLSAADRRVIFIPDATLGVLPAAAFRNPSTGKLLIEEYEILNSPSLSLMAQMPAKRESSMNRPALVVGDPALDPVASRRLPGLPGALREAEAVAGLYTRAVLLTGPEATKSRFLQALRLSRVLHFAGHVEVNQDSFVETAFHLAAEGADRHSDARVTLSDLSDVTMDHLELAVLSGCDTARAVGANREDLGGLGAVFLARGVRNVVATLVPVTDDWAPEFMRVLHARILAGERLVSAFRLGILAEIKQNEGNLGQWANYVILGGLDDGL